MSDNQPSTTDSTDSSQTLQRLGNIILTVGDVECRQWDDITIDSDIGIPADGWSFAWLDKTIADLPDSVKSGAVCQIDVENNDVRETILVGVIDKIQQTVSRGQISVVISGRDLAGQLLDTSAPITQEQNMTLFEIIRQFVIQDGDLQSLPWRVRPQDDNWLRAKTGIQDGESVWDAINKAAEASGQYVWMSSDGAICIGNPFDVEQPKEPPVFILNEDNAHNNCLNLSYSEDLSNAYSIVEAIGQDDKGKNFRGAANDDRMTIKRRKILSDSRAENQSDAMQYAQKALRDSWLDAYECSVLTNHWGWMSKVFATGWRVKVISTIMPRASGDWVIYGRTLKLTRNDGKTTELRLKKYQEWMQPVQHVDLIKDTKPKKSKKQTTIKSKRSKS